MSVRLSNDDCCAVDLLLEHAQTPSQGISSCFTQAPSAQIQQRLTRVEKILDLLNQYPAGEPAANLIAQTLSRCDQPATACLPEITPSQPFSAPR